LRLLFALAVLLLSAGCGGRYADFTLPELNTEGSAGPFTWIPQPEPVVAREEMSDVLNPSVVRFRGEYWNLYSEFDGRAWHTAVATSADGAAWAKRGRVISPEPADGAYIAANGSALPVGKELWYWYEVGYPLRIALAKTTDGENWTREPGYVLDRGPYRSFDEIAVADPYVVRAGEVFYMYYLGQDRAGRQQLGVARSEDGIAWEKLRANPILTGGPTNAFDEDLGEPAVWNSGGWWWMLYTGRAHDERRILGLARSRNGITWAKVPEFRIEGDQPWNSKVMADPSVEPQPDATIRVWFGGGDVASPDQNLHGQIGVGILH
jgi:predicted GH43/DUF377 family glycosyl hydrolase